MERINILLNFFSAIENDPRIGITHIAIFAAIFQYWSEHGFQSPIQAYSHQIMAIAKMNSHNIYIKRINELSRYGYIKYEASFKRNQSSKICFLLDESCHSKACVND